MDKLTQRIDALRGVGPQKAALFARLSLFTVGDLLTHYPRAYEDRTHCVPLRQATAPGPLLVQGMVAQAPRVSRMPGGRSCTRLRIVDESGALPVLFFQNPYVASRLHVGESYFFFGRVQDSGYGPTLINPEWEPAQQAGRVTGRLMALYPTTAGLSQRLIAQCVEQALPFCAHLPDFMPPSLLQRRQLPPLAWAMRAIHRPQSAADILAARQRLTYDELLIFSLALQQLSQRRGCGIAFSCLDPEPFYAALPFRPTEAQRRAVQQATEDIRTGRVLQRLVQGDVGCGKTTVAAALCYLAIQSGYQAALMAPTELLASQHAQRLTPLMARFGIRTVLLTGSLPAAQKRAALACISDGSAGMVIGTHALIQQRVSFARLALLVTDEQHRFGVAQRAALAAKGSMPHTLIMSATPIPRTLALTLYGDLDVSIIDQLPPDRKPVRTFAVGESMRPRIHRFIYKICQMGQQCFVVCPRVEEGEDTSLKSAEAHAQALQLALPSLRIGCLHGRMKPEQKQRLMARFAAGEMDVLVSTTVIEVGVDVPGATLMIVENAERFGLSQLHQLRGRVGRGQAEAYCILFGADQGRQAQERLNVLCQSNDGFRVAEEDLRLRGPGDFFGQRQSGLPLFRLANLHEELALLERTRQDAADLLRQPEGLAPYPRLQRQVKNLYQKLDFPCPDAEKRV